MRIKAPDARNIRAAVQWSICSRRLEQKLPGGGAAKIASATEFGWLAVPTRYLHLINGLTLVFPNRQGKKKLSLVRAELLQLSALNQGSLSRSWAELRGA
jgi:hypothetical protein